MTDSMPSFFNLNDRSNDFVKNNLSQKNTQFKSNSNIISHSIRFLQWISAGIQTLAYQNDILAISRIDGTLEIWRNIYTQMTYTGSIFLPRLQMQQSLAFGPDNRLFGCSLDGTVSEFNLDNFTISSQIDTGAPVWCIKISNNGNYIAVGCEDGALRIFTFSEKAKNHHNNYTFLNNETLKKNNSTNEISKKNTFLLDSTTWIVQDSRVLSLTWSDLDNIIYVGSAQFLASVDFKKKQVLEKMSLSSENNVIWCWSLLFINNSNLKCLVSGTSNGHVTFWDPQFLTPISDFEISKVDILSLETFGNYVYATGIFPKIEIFSFYPEERKWLHDGSKVQIGKHDIRSMISLKKNEDQGSLFLGNLAGDLFLVNADYYSHKKLLFKQRFFYDQNATCAPYANLILYHNQDVVTLYRLGSGKIPIRKEEEGQFFPTIEKSTVLTQPSIIFRIKIENIFQRIISSGISPDGKIFAISDGNSVKIYKISWKNGCSIKKLKSINEVLKKVGNIIRLYFNQNQILMMISSTGELIPFDLNNISCFGVLKNHQEELLKQKVVSNSEKFPRIFKGCWDEAGNLFASVDRNGVIVIYKFQKKQFKVLKIHFEPGVEDLSFSPDGTKLALIFRNQISIFNTDSLNFENFFENENLKQDGHQVLFLSNDIFIISSDGKITSCDFENGIRKILEFDDLLAIDWICSDKTRELVLIRKSMDLTDPPFYEKKKYTH